MELTEEQWSRLSNISFWKESINLSFKTYSSYGDMSFQLQIEEGMFEFGYQIIAQRGYRESKTPNWEKVLTILAQM